MDNDVSLALANAEFNDDHYNLQLAAELGKTLLERNQELEENARRLQAVIEHQSQEIEYLTAQTCQLRDANETRLRIYEALEQSVAELERNNRSLQDEGKTDKKRIKALCASLELVEQHCEELQEEVDTMRVTANVSQLHQLQQPNGQQSPAAQAGTKGKTGRNGQTGNQLEHGKLEQEGRGGTGRRNFLDYTSSEESSHTDEESGIHGSDESDFAGFEDTPLELQEVLRLRSELVRLRSQISREQRMRENLSSELERSVQENARLRDELLSSRERERLSLNIQMEMGGTVPSLDLSKDNKSDSLNEEDEQCEVDSGMNSGAEQESEAVEKGNTLLYELDMQYRVLIEKYEALLEARKRDIEAEQAMAASVHSQIHSDTDAVVSTCSETTSSDSHLLIETTREPNGQKDAACQTEIQVLKKRGCSEQTSPINGAPTRSSLRLPATEPAISTNRTVHLSGQTQARNASSCLASFSEADQETFNKHFEHSPPEYKKLFAEIFAVLKKKVAEMPMCEITSDRQPTPILPDLESHLECNLEKLKATVPPHVRFTRSYAEVVRARQQQAQQVRAQAQRNVRSVGMN
ncbi:cerebellar degeneration-related protein 2-like isoform X2 [Varroa jacobsoni]|uniref:cerebellar degeneration-related protein 2-like isoform X2 n=1 Tax=Varroa jacobsoni TaxID=62625 RepID=UPI000BF4CA4A|nr:cerebellar degeneration-related protein 2-like isoform X2 [Varroa jacobsoni]